MMLAIFIIMLFAVLAAWMQRRRIALLGYALTMVLAICSFISHITSTLNLQL